MNHRNKRSRKLVGSDSDYSLSDCIFGFLTKCGLFIVLSSFVPLLIVYFGSDATSFLEVYSIIEGDASFQGSVDRDMSSLLDELHLQKSKYDSFKVVLDTKTVSRVKFDKLKEKALQISSELIRVKSEVEKYKSDSIQALQREREVSLHGDTSSAKLNATFAMYLKKAKDQIDKLKKDLSVQEKANEKLEQQLESKTKDQSTELSKVGTLEEELENSREEIKTYKRQIKSLEKEKSSSQDKLSQLETKLETLSIKDEDKQNDLICSKHIEKLQSRIEELKTKADSLETENFDLEDEKQTLTKENTMLKKKIEKLEQENKMQQQQQQQQFQQNKMQQGAQQQFQQQQFQQKQQFEDFGNLGFTNNNNFNLGNQQQQQQNFNQNQGFNNNVNYNNGFQQQQQNSGNFNQFQNYNNNNNQQYNPCNNGRIKKFEFDSDRPGVHYNSQQVDSARKCREMCSRDQMCKAWVYAKSQAICFLKNQFYDIQPSGCCVSGIICNNNFP